MSSIVDTPYSTLPQPKSGWQLFKSLASGSLTPGLAWQNPAYRRKFMLRSLATPFTTARLLGNLAKQPRLMQILRVQPGLPCRLHRPWLTVNMGRQTTLDALNDHYEMMSRHLPASLLPGQANALHRRNAGGESACPARAHSAGDQSLSRTVPKTSAG